MEIFLGAEIEGPATSKWFDLQKEFSELLGELKDESYGDSLTSIGIISILMHPEYFEGEGYKERRYYSRKNKEADIRLRINYTDFVNANKEIRKGNTVLCSAGIGAEPQQAKESPTSASAEMGDLGRLYIQRHCLPLL